jgi:hypothetical protein
MPGDPEECRRQGRECVRLAQRAITYRRRKITCHWRKRGCSSLTFSNTTTRCSKLGQIRIECGPICTHTKPPSYKAAGILAAVELSQHARAVEHRAVAICFPTGHPPVNPCLLAGG